MSAQSQPATAEPTWLVEQRAEARARFDAVGLPTSRLEAWKWSSTRALGEVDFQPADRVDLDGVAALVEASRLPDADAELVFVSGQLQPSLGSSREVDGLTVGSVRDAKLSSVLEGRLGRLAAWEEPADAFTALNAAAHQDGAYVHAGRGLTGAMVHLLHVGAPQGQATASHLRHVFIAETGASLTVVETYVGTEGQSLTTTVDEVWVEPGAQLRQSVLSEEPEGHHLVHTLRARIDRDAFHHAHFAWIGAGWTRSDVDVSCAGPGAESALDGVLVLGGKAHVDNHTRVEHAVPNTRSDEAYDAVLGGKARGIFDGLIVVQPDAQRTDAKQSSRNLLVSADATANAKPTLEIYADDVKCAHGTTVGQLDREQLGYLRSRGIPVAIARQLLTGAFVAERVHRLQSPALRERVQARVDAALTRLQEAS